jgi:hypothetical protein
LSVDSQPIAKRTGFPIWLNKVISVSASHPLYALAAYNLGMLFVELTPFIAFRAANWTDEELRALQNHLLDNPNAGDVIRGSSGLRKLRWAASGRGKRGGARVIYYHYVSAAHIYLIYGYAKNEQEDLTPDQIKLLAQLMKDITHG